MPADTVTNGAPWTSQLGGVHGVLNWENVCFVFLVLCYELLSWDNTPISGVTLTGQSFDTQYQWRTLLNMDE